MVLNMCEAQTVGVSSVSQEVGSRPWTAHDDRGEWAAGWPEVEAPIGDGPTHEGDPALGAGIPWLWQLLSYAATGGDARLELLRLTAASAAQPVRARTLNALGRFAWRSGDVTSARAFYQEALVIGRATCDYASRCCSLSGLATVALAAGSYDLARGLQQENAELRRRLGDLAGVARALATLGWLAAERGSPAEAQALHEECLGFRRQLGDDRAVALSLLHLGWLAHLRRDRGSARRLLKEALDTVWDRGDRWKIVVLLGVLGRPPLVGTMTEQAVRLLAGAEVLDEPDESLAAEVGRRAHQLAEVHERLSAHGLAAVLADGCATSIEALVDRTLRASSTPVMRASGPATERQVMVLTAREREVAVLVGRGYTNHRIADALVITERTAETHVRNIREKLGFATRTQVAAWVAAHGLIPTAGAGSRDE